MDKMVLKTLRKLKKEFEKEGFVIDAVFGSYARGEQTSTSDVDILYHLEDEFLKNYSGFIGFKKLDEIKRSLADALEKKVDLAPANMLSKTAKRYIMDELIYV